MLSNDAKKALRAALASKGLHGFAEEVIAAIDSNGSGPAAHVSNIEPTVDMTAIPASFADLAAARSAVNTLRSDAEARLDAIEAKIDAILAALQSAGMMS